MLSNLNTVPVFEWEWILGLVLLTGVMTWSCTKWQGNAAAVWIFGGVFLAICWIVSMNAAIGVGLIGLVLICVAYAFGIALGEQGWKATAVPSEADINPAVPGKQDLDEKWLSKPITARNVFNMVLDHVGLQFEGYDGSTCRIANVDDDLLLKDRDTEGLRILVPRVMDAIIELGDELKTHRDYKLMDHRLSNTVE